MMEKKWLIKKNENLYNTQVLAKELKLNNDVIAKLLFQREIRSFREAQNFFRPKMEDLHDPFLMKDMKKAVERFQKAIHNNEKILILGDYDVDGTTAVSLFQNVIKDFYSNFDYYIPDRYKEGYGLNIPAVDFAKNNDFSLIICLDCGVTAIEQIKYGNKLGIDFIICDHHNPGAELPDAIILNPKRKDCEYPFKELCGCGVGFKFLCAYFITENKALFPLYEQLDLLALSIGADIVSVKDENRILAYFGLKVFNENPRKAFLKIIDIANKKRPLTLTDLSFSIAPRINAAGRMSTGVNAVKLLTETEENQIQDVVKLIEELNKQRKDFDQLIVQESLLKLELEESNFKKSIIIHDENWHKGVLGIVASRVLEKYYKPTIILSEIDGVLTGSARSIPGINMYEVLSKCSEYLIQYGGHYFAAGLSLTKENLDFFKEKFEQVISEISTEETFVPILEIDQEVQLKDLFETNESPNGLTKFFRILRQFEPFGPDNNNPIFLVKNIQFENAKLLKEEHLKVTVKENGFNFKMDAIGFNMPEKYFTIKEYEEYDLVFTLSSNTWNNSTKLQLQIIDFRKSA